MKEFRNISRSLQVVFIILVILAVAGIAGSGYLYRRVRALENPDAIAQQQVKDTVADVSKVLVLPTDETPTLATVADPEKLKDQPFFAHAQAGDVVLIYSNAKRAILWRPSTKQVVEVSPLNTPTGTASTTQTTQAAGR